MDISIMVSTYLRCRDLAKTNLELVVWHGSDPVRHCFLGCQRQPQIEGRDIVADVDLHIGLSRPNDCRQRRLNPLCRRPRIARLGSVKKLKQSHVPGMMIVLSLSPFGYLALMTSERGGGGYASPTRTKK